MGCVLLATEGHTPLYSFGEYIETMNDKDENSHYTSKRYSVTTNGILNNFNSLSCESNTKHYTRLHPVSPIKVAAQGWECSH